MSDRSARLAGLYASVAAVLAFLLAPLLALSYFATEDGRGELDAGSVAAWAEPARDAVGGLLTFASADDVYSWYGRAFALVVPALILCARAVRARRPSTVGRSERYGWRVALVGYSVLAVGVACAFWTPLLTASFYVGVLPGLLLSVAGSTVLGIALIRAGSRPRATAWLLALSFPLWIAASVVLGHNSLGLLPLFVAWAAAGVRLRSVDAVAGPASETFSAPRRGSVAPPQGSASAGR